MVYTRQRLATPRERVGWKSLREAENVCGTGIDGREGK